MTEARFRFERLTLASDPRGFVYEPLEPERLGAQRNVHVVVTVPGEVRGNHRHPGTEILTVLGPARVRVRLGGAIHDTDVPRGEVYRFTVPPDVPHAVKNTGRTTNLLVAFRDVEHDASAITREQLL